MLLRKYGIFLRCMGTSLRFSANLRKGQNFLHFLVASLDDIVLLVRVYS